MAQKNANKAKQGASWGAIVLLLVFFFYIGIPVMLNKLHKDKENMLANAKKTTTVGKVFFGIGCLYVLMGLTGSLTAEDGSSVLGMIIVMVALFCGGGFAIIRHAKKYKNLGLLYERYRPVISGSPDGSLDDMAEVLCETFDETTQNIQSLIGASLLEDSYIDRARRILVSPLVASMHMSRPLHISISTNYPGKTKSATPEIRTIKCPNCGGVNNIAEGAANVCDFCGSPLE